MERINEITRYLAGEMSLQELLVFQDSIEKDKKFKDLFDEYQMLWNASQDAAPMSFTPQRSYEDLRSKLVERGHLSAKEVQLEIERNDNVVPMTRVSDSKRSVFRRYRSIAAVAIMGLLVASVGLFMLNSDNDQTVVWEASDSVRSFVLSDGSEVVLDKNSSLKQLGDRKVELHGRCMFDVKSENEKTPFEVFSDIGKVYVTGTSFSVDSENNTTRVLVQEGSVNYIYESDTIYLEEGEGYIFDNDTGSKTFFEVKKNHFSWFGDQGLIIENVPLSELLEELSVVYQVDFDFENLNSKNCLYSATSPYKNSDFKPLLDELVAYFGFSSQEIDNNHYLLSGGLDCD